MKYHYIDLHIHTSKDSNNLDSNYDVNKLLAKVKEVAGNHDFLISLTDHNRINKDSYMKLVGEANFLVGVELHIRNVKERPPYHCHFYFNLNEENLFDDIDNINAILNELYPNPMPNNNDNIPQILEVVNKFNDYDFLILPHGGQSHSTFDESISDDMMFDTTIERTIYYNLFDGFTARSDIGLEKTIKYFKKLGINEFINLITCSDNYNPNIYPNDNNNSNFIPTWMYAKPTFDGLRIALTEKTRLYYGETPPVIDHEIISNCQLKNENIDIDVNFSKGLNVVIGNSSSGKTLLIDSIYNKIKNDFSNSVYEEDYFVSEIDVVNNSNVSPHYFKQNYILEMTKSGSDNLGDNEVIKKAFPANAQVKKLSSIKIANIITDITNLFDYVKNIEELREKIKRIPSFPRLIILDKTITNILEKFFVNSDDEERLVYLKADYESDLLKLDDLIERQKSIEFFDDITPQVTYIKDKITKAYNMIEFENKVRKIILQEISDYSDEIESDNTQSKNRKNNLNSLITYITSYKNNLDSFYSTLNNIATNYNYKVDTESYETPSNHKLYIENKFELTKESILNHINKFKTSVNKISNFEDINPESLFSNSFDKRSIKNYEDLKAKIIESINKDNKINYKIIYEGIKDFNELSPGLKTSVILDLILENDKDNAPIIIDQPEDNLATNYLNHGLIDVIKKAKYRRQLIVVTHNATIPMLADANRIIICDNNDNMITIRSAFLEDNVNGTSVTDKIAKLTDGGKASIKKRFKKYNLRKFIEEESSNEVENI